VNQTDGQSPIGLRIIGSFKLVTALLLVGLGFGLFHHMGSGPGDQALHLVHDLRIDPENHYIHAVIERISGISPRQLRLIQVGTFLYALLYATEGVGLLWRKLWAEYFTVIATGSLIPLEIYEVWRRPTLVRLAILAINVAIVAYLVHQLVRRQKAQAGAKNAPAAGGPSIT